MTPISQSEIIAPRPIGPRAPAAAPPRPSRLLTGIYHDIGMAAVAESLDLAADSLDPDSHQAVKRGCRYIHLMPKRQEAPATAA